VLFKAPLQNLLFQFVDGLVKGCYCSQKKIVPFAWDFEWQMRFHPHIRLYVFILFQHVMFVVTVVGLHLLESAWTYSTQSLGSDLLSWHGIMGYGFIAFSAVDLEMAVFVCILEGMSLERDMKRFRRYCKFIVCEQIN